MIIEPSIPDVQGVKDPAVARILQAMKQVIELRIGHIPKRAKIKKLGASPDYAGLVNKLNEVVNRLENYDDTDGAITAPKQDSTTTPAFVRTGAWTPVDASGVGLTLVNDIAPQWKRFEAMVIAFFGVSYPVTVDTSNAVVGGLPFNVSTRGAVVFSFENAVAGLMADALETTNTMRIQTASGAQRNVDLSGKALRGFAIYLTGDA